MSTDRRGFQTLQCGEELVQIRFTWAAIDSLGRAGVAELLDKAGSGQPGDMGALATLLEAASGGHLRAAKLLAGDDVNFAEAYVCLIKAWTAAARRPVGAERAENPRIRLWTSLKTLWRRLWQRA